MQVRPKDDHTYALDLHWEGARGEGTTSCQAHGRDYRIQVAGQADPVAGLGAGADRPSRGVDSNRTL